jgi:hypothetical protein
MQQVRHNFEIETEIEKRWSDSVIILETTICNNSGTILLSSTEMS